MITSAPWAFFCACCLVAVVLWFSLNFLYRERIQNFKETIEHLKTKIEHGAATSPSADTQIEGLRKDFKRRLRLTQVEVEQKMLEQQQISAPPSGLRETEALPLTPLQKEAFQFADDLRQWRAGVGTMETPPLVAGESSSDYLRRTRPQRDAYLHKLIYGYANKFSDRAKALYCRFGEENTVDLALAGMVEQIKAADEADAIAARFEALVIRQLKPEACVILRLQ